MLKAENRKIWNRESIKYPLWDLIKKWLSDGEKVTVSKPKVGIRARFGQYIVVDAHGKQFDQAERINYERAIAREAARKAR